jgi:hypothetical protein
MWYACWCVLTLLYCTTVRSGVQIDDMAGIPAGYVSGGHRARGAWRGERASRARRDRVPAVGMGGGR